MAFPGFFDDAPTIALHDPLAAFLGAAAGGAVTYTYTDAVKLAGHSCPTVAGAYLMVCRGLRHLYGDAVPERGGVEVHLRDRRDEGTTGVIAAIATLLTGAAPETGFGGIGPRQRFSRRDLLHFSAPIDALMALRRRDDGRGVLVDLDTSRVPADPGLAGLFPKLVAGRADAEEQARFGALWQGRVAAMLTSHADDPGLIRIREWKTAA